MYDLISQLLHWIRASFPLNYNWLQNLILMLKKMQYTLYIHL